MPPETGRIAAYRVQCGFCHKWREHEGSQCAVAFSFWGRKLPGSILALILPSWGLIFKYILVYLWYGPTRNTELDYCVRIKGFWDSLNLPLIPFLLAVMWGGQAFLAQADPLESLWAEHLALWYSARVTQERTDHQHSMCVCMYVCMQISIEETESVINCIPKQKVPGSNRHTY